MAASPKDQLKGYIDGFFEAITNLFIFFPHFFSVTALFRSLFSPWKNITDTTKSRAFSLEHWFNQLLFNIISRTIGFFMRCSILLFYIIVQVLYLTLIPFLMLFFFVTIPIAYLAFIVKKPEEERKQELKEQFVRTHLLKPEHTEVVEKWFEYIYDLHLRPHPWWKLKHLMSIPPLARDWRDGFTPTLDTYAEDLTDPTYQMQIRSHIIGRDQETGLMERVLSKSDEANAIIVGERGVGKHSVIQSFAKKIYEGRTNSLLSYKRVLKLNMEKILTMHADMKQREQFLEELLNEASQAGNVIILIDDIHRYISSGGDRIDLSSVIEKYGQTNKLQIIGITTPFLYETYIYPNTKIRIIFTKIDIEEVNANKALHILMSQAVSFEKRFKVYIPFETIQTIIEKSDFYITSIPFPAKALQLLDNVCVYTSQTMKQNMVMPESVGVVLTNKTHVPTTLDDTVKDKLLNLESLLSERILGQQEALSEISSTFRRSFLLLGKRRKPLASFLFLGPTGVGKTETSKVIASVFFGAPTFLTRFDMSMYQSKSDIATLVGNVERLNPGLLTNAIREHPYGVLLLDEIEKAHPDLLNIFLTLLDEGYFIDGYGQRVDCKNLVIVATSNAGSDHIHQMIVKQSLNKEESDATFSTNHLIDYLVEKRLFTPEFLNRFDGVIAYKPLEVETAASIAKTMINEVANTIYDSYKIHIQISDKTIEDLTRQGYDPQYGARNLERILRQQVEDKIAKIILAGKAAEGDTIRL